MAIKRRGNVHRTYDNWAYLFISPWLIGFILFTMGPMIASLYLSFTKYNIIELPQFVGLANYIKLFTADPKFWHSLQVTVVFAIFEVPLSLLFGFTLAFLLNLKIPGTAFWRTLFYMPSITSGVAMAMLWGMLFNPRFGLINYLLSLVNIKGPGWFASPLWALPALILIGLWGVGGGMIIYLAGLQSIPTSLYEAAWVDGADGWQQLLHITLPLMTPVIFYNLVLGVIGTFQYFTEAFILTAGGPAEATLFYNLYLYRTGFQYLDMGYASALAWVLFLIVLILTGLIFKSSALWVYYEGEVRS